MPKLKVFPTPAQAKVLQGLADFDGMFVFYIPYETGRSTARWATNGLRRSEWDCKKRYGKPRASTIRKMIREGWLESESEKRQHYYVLSDTGRDMVSRLTPEHLYSKRGLAAWQVLDALKKRHPFDEWIFVEELRLGTAWGMIDIPGYHKRVDFAQRVDAFALHTWPSKKFQRWAYEIKVSRSDFLRELENPDKRIGAMHISNYFYFAAPEGLIKHAELPDQCGLMEIVEGKSKITVRAPWREACDPYWALVASIGRSLLK